MHSFGCFLPQGATGDQWAFDASHVFYDGRLAKGMLPHHPVVVLDRAVNSIGDLAVSDGALFSVDITDGVRLLNRIDGKLKVLSSNFYADDRNVFDRSFKRIEGIDAGRFSVVKPVCPVPEQPELRCVAPKGDDGGYGIQEGVLVVVADSVVGSRKIPIEGLSASKVVVFTLNGVFSSVGGESSFMLFNDRLYSLGAFERGRLVEGVPVRGPLRSIPKSYYGTCELGGDFGAGLDRYVLDDTGGIDMTDLKHVGQCRPY